MNLTDLTVQKLQPGTYMDEKLPGFGIRVGLRRRTWIVVKGRGRVKTAIGHYPSLSLSDARKRAMAALLAPSGAKSAPTFPDARTAFLAQSRWRPRTLQVVTSSLKHFTWTKAIDKITKEEVSAAIAAIDGPSAQAHALKDLRAFFNWADLDKNPCTGLKGQPYRPRERVLTDAELKKVWHAAEGLGLYGVQVRLLILTGQRANQIINYDPAWLKDDLITFPAAVMKNDREHQIPVGPMTLALLPALSKAAMQGKMKAKLDKESGVSNWVLHDLRRVLASQWAALGISLPTTETYLSHRSGSFAGIVGVYQKYTWLPEMRHAVRIWEDKVQSLAR